MSYNLTIDQGNSSSKICVFEKDNVVDSFRFDRLTVSELQPIFDKYDVQGAIISSVQNEDKELIAWLQGEAKHFIELTNLTPTPMHILYDNAKSLGHDRIAAAVGAMEKSPRTNLMIIDAGTAITLDAVDAAGTFLGGNISPGLSIRFQALNSFTDKLPLVTQDGEIPLIGHDTITAIRSGVVSGVISEIEGYVANVTRQLGNVKVYITGGDGKFLASRLSFKATEEDYLLAFGLNRILLYNK